MTRGKIKLGNQFPKSEVETYWKWARLGFTWNKFVDNTQCDKCSYSCKSLGQARKHQKIHTTKIIKSNSMATNVMKGDLKNE